MNVRHIGLLRAYVTPSHREAVAAPVAGNFVGKTSAEILRDSALVRKCAGDYFLCESEGKNEEWNGKIDKVAQGR